ncbi:MAG TPA: SDR family oxidoreductase [Streptosporangiaceae bacterium]|jgi:NAD(P)-dependent dehydrogenase (short-subunit alcohol dehydrogenase family)|nr:SDR family oxidoreductase [Streptosporangiaceae bacterium]
MFELAGKTAVVTGGGRGIGRGITLALAAAGANVVLAGRTAEPLESAAQQARALGVTAIPVVADITVREDLDRLAAAGHQPSGYIDCWVNNAGSARPQDVGPLLDLTEAQWDAVTDINLKWTFFACQAAARAMSGGGTIINVSSRSGSQPNPMTGQYGAAKAGLENLTATMAVEWGHLGVRVNAVAPGVVLTPEGLASGSMSRPSRRQRQIDTIPLRRLGAVEDIAWVCVFLASDEAGWITGETIHVTGGSRISIGYLTYMHRVTERLAAAGPSAAPGQPAG